MSNQPIISPRNRSKSIVAVVMVVATSLFSAGVVSSQESSDGREVRSWGQRGGHGPGARFGDPSRLVKRMTRFLELSDTQEQTINNIVDAARPEFQALRERGRASAAAMRDLDTTDPDYSAKLTNLAIANGELATEGTILFGRVRAEVTAELTDEQRERLESRLSEGRMSGWKHGRRGRDRQRGADDRGR